MLKILRSSTAQAALMRQAEADAVISAMHRSAAVIEFALDGTVLSANPNFLATMGYALEEIVGRHHSLFLPPGQAETAEYREFWRRLNDGEVFTAVWRRVAKGGRNVVLQASYNPVLRPDGKPYKVIKFASDITAAEDERNRLQAAAKAEHEQQSLVVGAIGTGLQQLARGDLSTRIELTFAGPYAKLKEDFNAAMAALAETMGVIGAAAETMKVSSHEMASASGDLARRTEQQAATLEQTAAALNELTSVVRQSAEGSAAAAQNVAKARAAATASGEVMRQAAAAIDAIATSSQEIGQIIGVMDGIAFQTNLLALNAGVEAARAGDAGRGFAVVASEVRALAQRSSEAAKQIKTLVQSSASQVSRGVELVGATSQALDGIVGSVLEVDQLVANLANATKEQATGLAEINTAMHQMDQVTQQNAAVVEQTNAASAALRAEAGSLATEMSRFHTGNEPAKAPPAPPVPLAPPPPAARRGRKLAVVGNAAIAAQEDWTEF